MRVLNTMLLFFVSLVYLACTAKAHSSGISSSPSAQLRMRKSRPSKNPSSSPSPSPSYLGPIVAPYYKFKPRHHRHRHRHRQKPHAVSPNPDARPGCDHTCSDPLTPSPVETPCGCVLPMKVRLLLSKPVYALFPEVYELANEIASGTYLRLSQVQIVGATADPRNQDRTFVDINLVPLGERFDNTTAMLTYERFRLKEVPLNRTLFGNYDMVHVDYPGISSTYPPASGPAGPGHGQHPFGANVVNKNKIMNSIVIFVIAFSALVTSVALVAAVFLLMKWRKLQKPSSAVRPMLMASNKTGIGSTLSSSLASSPSLSLFASMPTSALPVKTFLLSELEKATDKFSSMRILGEGGFGRVYHGILEDGNEVAVKLLNRDLQSGDREFIAEVEMLSRLHHRNLVKLIGICIEGHRRCLVYELVHNGSVESHLHGPDMGKGPLPLDARMKIALGAARGLAYLHEDSNPRVIHQDFKASNVLLDEDYTPKVADFGLAREATEGSEHVSTRVIGTFGYVAPEYAMTGHLLVKSDVYSYGVVLLELLTGR